MAMYGSNVPVDRQPSPSHLPLNLSSNNPFRNRTTSPSPRSADAPAHKFPMASTNPFLDASEYQQPTANYARGPPNDARPNKNMIPADIFSDLSLLDKPIQNAQPPLRTGPPSRAGTLPVQGHRPMASDERRDRLRGPPRPPASPDKSSTRPRRASESSVMEKDRRPRTDRDRSERPERTESEERRRRERRREREERHRREKEKSARSGGRMKKPQGLDIIDKLDVTGIYGQGLFHHDGPFDACNPHRNAKKSRHAPMQAFPAGSANMALGGSGPLRSNVDLDRFHGRGDEGFTDFATTRKADAPQFVDPTQRIEQVHGEETSGLGTSTFLEGAPASRSALQRRDSEDPNENNVGGLSRKKSIAQRFRGRGMSNSRKNPELTSPEARYQRNYDSDSPPQVKASSAGGPARLRYNNANEINPFENDYEAAFDKKGAQIRIAEREGLPSSSRPRAPSSPKHGTVNLVRTRTAEDGVRRPSDEEKPSGGFLNRMRSLKGGRRQQQRSEAS